MIVLLLHANNYNNSRKTTECGSKPSAYVNYDCLVLYFVCVNIRRHIENQIKKFQIQFQVHHSN